MNDIDSSGASPTGIKVANRLTAMANRVDVDDRLGDIKGEIRYATVTKIGRPRRAWPIVGIAGLAAASIGVVALIVSRPNTGEQQSEAPAAASPTATTVPAASPLMPFAVLPVIDEADIPIPGLALNGSYAARSATLSWVTQTFVAGIDDAEPRFTNTPTEVISMTAFPATDPATVFPEAKPGRRPEVGELNWGESSTLVWGEDGTTFTIVGSDLDLMYELVDRTDPMSPQADFAFFVEEPLPGGLIALNPPMRGRPGLFPVVNSEGGEFMMEMFDEPALQLHPGQPLERIKLGGYDAWLVTRDPDQAPVLSIELTTRQSLTVFGLGLTREQLLAIAGKISFVDEVTWREHYNVTEFPLDGRSEVRDPIVADTAVPAADYIAPATTSPGPQPTVTVPES